MGGVKANVKETEIVDTLHELRQQEPITGYRAKRFGQIEFIDASRRLVG